MATLSKDEARRYRAGKHADHAHSDECEGCGRRVYGNGGKVAHYRKCRPYLEKYGWTFNAGDAAALRRMARETVDNDWYGFYRRACLVEARHRGLIN